MRIDLEIVTYKDDSFGVSMALGKDALKALITNFTNNSDNDMYNTLVNMVSGFTVNASAYFNKDNLLQSVGFSFDCEAKIDQQILKYYSAEASLFKTCDVSYVVKGQETINFKYNDAKVDLPDFSDYKEVELEK